MKSDINLVSDDAGSLSPGARRLKKFRTIATSVVLAVGGLSILLFFLNRVFSPDSVIKAQNEVATAITAQKNKQTNLIHLNGRLNDILSIVKKRANYDVVLNALMKEAPSEIAVTSLSMDEKKMSIIVSSPSLIPLGNFIDSLKVMAEKKQFLKNVIVNNLTLSSKASSYSLTLDMDLL